MERLASAILIQTVKDWNSPKERAKIEAFLKTEWFETLADTAGVEPDKIRQMLVAGNYQQLRLRAAYR